jgi:PEP-CTERM motif
MAKYLVGLLVVAAILFLGTSSASAQTQLASCTGGYGETGSCGGALSNPSFLFEGPLYTGNFDNQFAVSAAPGAIQFGVGTNGGAFIYNGIYCDYGVQIGGTGGAVCDGDVIIASNISMGTPDDTGYAPGAVVSVTGPGTIQGFFCDPCGTEYGYPPQVAFATVTTTYQFTLTAPGTQAPWTLTSASFNSLPSTPEPSTLLLFGSGLFLLGIIICQK